MGSVHRKSRSKRHLTPIDWPSSFDPEIDGTRWELGSGPDEADKRPIHAFDGPPDDDPIWDVWADEAACRDRIERGYCL